MVVSARAISVSFDCYKIASGLANRHFFFKRIDVCDFILICFSVSFFPNGTLKTSGSLYFQALILNIQDYYREFKASSFLFLSLLKQQVAMTPCRLQTSNSKSSSSRHTSTMITDMPIMAPAGISEAVSTSSCKAVSCFRID